MNKLLITTIAISLAMPKSNTSNVIHKSFPTDEQVKVTIESAPTDERVKVTIKSSLEDLINAIIYVESRGNDSAIGDNGLAVGCLQIHPICIREANRIIGFDSFCLDDRYDRQQSINVSKTIKKRYANKSNEAIARNWNGGPLGYKKKSTIKYWNKVQTRLQNKYE